MRWLPVLMMLALIPAAQGQQFVPPGSVDMELFLDDEALDVGDSTNLTVVLEFTCPLVSPDMAGQYLSFLDIHTSDPYVMVVGPLSRTMEGDCMRDQELWAVFEFQVLTSDYANGTVLIDVAAQVESPNEQIVRSPEEVEGTQAIKVAGPEAETPDAADESPEPIEQTVPGPALPLLAVGLLALVRRRQG